jgi:hypothetical protein
MSRLDMGWGSGNGWVTGEWIHPSNSYATHVSAPPDGPVRVEVGMRLPNRVLPTMTWGARWEPVLAWPPPKGHSWGEEDPDRDPQEPIPYDRSEEYRQDLGNPLYSLEE